MKNAGEDKYLAWHFYMNEWIDIQKNEIAGVFLMKAWYNRRTSDYYTRYTSR